MDRKTSKKYTPKRTPKRIESQKVGQYEAYNIILKVRRALGLNVAPWNQIPDYLLLVAFVHPDTTKHKLLAEDIQKHMQETYGLVNYESFEFLGDRILEVVVTNMMLEDYILTGTPGFFTQTKAALVKNASLECYMQSKDLCKCIIGVKTPTTKQCADIFEAIIGIMFYHLNNSGYGYTSINYIESWLNSEFDLRGRMYNVVVGREAC